MALLTAAGYLPAVGQSENNDFCAHGELRQDQQTLMQLKTERRTGDAASQVSLQRQQLVRDYGTSAREHSCAEQKLEGMPLYERDGHLNICPSPLAAPHCRVPRVNEGRTVIGGCWQWKAD
ncbi:hypothetical protein H920_15570 [Fukomys damarensis]|uniref:Uncharacterized protein n=1 Tax=Fukomys damarensis TaxID=885580 RepID=A0A091DGP0_FUKDA|nr:hypothetical protein H920_16640 [Fukomys damarensis]KFO23040.1 hypothetical protein H920_15570 [Fukomys damarensis]